MCPDGEVRARRPLSKVHLPCPSFQAIMEENKETLPLPIDPVAHPCDHVFKCVAPSRLQWDCPSVSVLTLPPPIPRLPEQCPAQGGLGVRSVSLALR